MISYSTVSLHEYTIVLLDNAAHLKTNKYNVARIENGLVFFPFAVDVCGTLQSDATRTGSALSLSVSFVR
jgi:hypothetical protein